MLFLSLALSLILLEIEAWPSGVSKTALNTFREVLSERDLLLIKERLKRLNAVHFRELQLVTKSPQEEKAAIEFSHDQASEEALENPNDEESINRRAGLSEYLYEGDILLTPDQALQKLKAERRNKRAAISKDRQKTEKWNRNRINYWFHGNMPSKQRRQIEEVLAYFKQHTCLRFVQSYPNPYENTIEFQMSRGCWSYVGKVDGAKNANGAQTIGFEWACFNQFGTIFHEIMHALGFEHEHVREDRDNYIVVNFKNIPKNETYNYDKNTDGDLQGFEYELGSLMQYGNPGDDAYNLEKSKIYAKDKRQILTIGQRMMPTFQDIAQINTLYKCYDRCSNTTRPACQNGGRPHVWYCNRCECPHGFSGDFCTDLEPSTQPSPNCGGILQAQVGQEQIYTAKAAVHGSMVFMTEKCYWHVQAPEGRRVKLFVSQQDLSCHSSCPWSALEVKTGKFNMTGTRRCCTAGTADDYYFSNSNLLVVALYVKSGSASVTWKYSAI